jgi:hypothetical protein
VSHTRGYEYTSFDATSLSLSLSLSNEASSPKFQSFLLAPFS